MYQLIFVFVSADNCIGSNLYLINFASANFFGNYENKILSHNQVFPSAKNFVDLIKRGPLGPSFLSFRRSVYLSLPFPSSLSLSPPSLHLALSLSLSLSLSHTHSLSHCLSLSKQKLFCSCLNICPPTGGGGRFAGNFR